MIEEINMIKRLLPIMVFAELEISWQKCQTNCQKKSNFDQTFREFAQTKT